MAHTDRPLPDTDITLCPRCEQAGIVVVTLPGGRTLCFRCLRPYEPAAYQNIVHWVIDHPPIDPKHLPPGG